MIAGCVQVMCPVSAAILCCSARLKGVVGGQLGRRSAVMQWSSLVNRQ